MDIREELLNLGGAAAVYFGKHPVQLLCLGLLIPLGTIILSSLNIFSDPEAFSKSGSVLVAFTILIVFVNHTNKEYLSRQEDFLSERGGTPASAREKMKGEFLSELEEEMSQEEFEEKKEKAGKIFVRALGPGFDDYIRKTNSLMGELLQETKSASLNLAIVEATLGISGTLIWGFG